MYSTHDPSPGHVERLQAQGVRVATALSEEDAQEQARDAEAIFGHRYLRQVLPQAGRLQWVQSTAGGTDGLPLAELRARNIALTRSTWDAEAIALHAVALALALVRDVFPQAGAYRPSALPNAALVFGAGAIGSAVAHRLRGLGVDRVYGVNRDGRGVAGFDAVFGGEAWQEVVGACSLVVDCLPLGALSLGRNVFEAMPKGGHFVGVGRVQNTDLAALEAALVSGQLAGAALDTHHLPPGRGAGVPNLIVTPHNASHDPQRGARIEAACEAQLRRFLLGEPLADRV